ncbi:hypothetical protein J6K93_06060 [Leuconostoc mesenteroides]|uniref:hypothetical protein n=1 Tax=Leuconostoc mesenteroides TaxID=1245 RepID=UPI001CBC6ADC|nr:hypothetical protein [Leuconostoc mesenteroides]MBZ1510740.1 hypothetical protein [Leuconostoc mesenteroides]MCM6827905.1 hypothetical protein [Leuconostoc mesenteroides]
MSWRKDIKYLKHNFKDLHEMIPLSRTKLTPEDAMRLESQELITLIEYYDGDFGLFYTHKGYSYIENHREQIALSVWIQLGVPTIMLIIGIVIGHLIK